MRGEIDMSSLFIIGNGFDIAHNLQTRYVDFKKFLIEKYEIDKNISLCTPEIHIGNHGEEIVDSEIIVSLFCRLLSEAKIDDKWSDFEEKLGQICYDEFFDHIEDINAANNPFRVAYQMEDVSSALCHSLPYIKFLFKEWILKIDIKNASLNRKFQEIINPEEDYFLNFNYTDTLEQIYKCKNVCHIHGKYNSNELLIGHGDNCDVVGCFDNMNYPGAICNLSDVKRAFSKDTHSAIKKNDSFFTSISNVDTIYSIGFSYSDVDMIYIAKICKILKSSKVIWFLNQYIDNLGNINHGEGNMADKIKCSGFMGNVQYKIII